MPDPRRIDRLDLLGRWEAARETRAVVVATRPDATIGMAECVRYLYEHFRELPQRPLDRIDLFLIGGGLTSAVAARIASLLREYGRELTMIVTGPVGPGETLASIAGDAVMMHPMATLTTVLPPGDTTTGLSSFVAHILRETEAERSYRPALHGADPAAIGDAIHRVEWVRHQVEQLCASRLAPPEDSARDTLVDALTRRVQRIGEPLARREARALDALPVIIPTPDIEALAFDLYIAYEHLLDLLAGEASDAPRAVIESATMFHTLERDTAGDPGDRWQRHFDAAVH